MKPVCFIFFSWSVWLRAPACTQPRAVMKTGHTPDHSDPRDDMESQVKQHPAQAKQRHVGPGLEPRPRRWAGCGALPCRSTGKPAIPTHSRQNHPLSCLLELYHHPNPVTERENDPHSVGKTCTLVRLSYLHRQPLPRLSALVHSLASPPFFSVQRRSQITPSTLTCSNCLSL